MNDAARPGFRVARLSEAYLLEVMAMELESYADPWSEGMFRQEVDNAASHFYVLLDGDHLVGYGGFWLLIDEAHITKLTVSTSLRRQGLGASLLQYLLRRAVWLGAATVRLEVRESNLPARRLYETAGFKAVGVRKGYYARTNENAIVMLKNLNEH
jgi:ribosomal-protein-alanine N-acetyltransferase